MQSFFRPVRGAEAVLRGFEPPSLRTFVNRSAGRAFFLTTSVDRKKAGRQAKARGRVRDGQARSSDIVLKPHALTALPGRLSGRATAPACRLLRGEELRRVLGPSRAGRRRAGFGHRVPARTEVRVNRFPGRGITAAGRSLSP